ncbi:MAG: hypothetical protein K2Y22_09230 [Candidatus Obscuribacterales bacterium]|nr:hypothetical protein [Candidatus Obscuribacterales bacterium]
MLKINLSTLSGALIGVAMCLSSCSMVPEKGWILHQTSPFAGEQIAYISRDGVKSVNPTMHITCIVRADNPKIIYFNDQTKVYSEQTIDEWKANLAKRKAGIDGIAKVMGDPPQKTLKKTGELEIAGIKATQYTEEGGTPPPAKPGGLGLQPTAKQDSELYFANDISVPEAFHLVSHKSMSLPENKGVLLRMVVTTGDGEKVTALDTTSFERQDLPPDTFAAPTGYKRVKNDMEVLMGEGAGQAMESLFNEFAKPETQKGTKDLFKAGDAAANYMDSVNSELKAGKAPHSGAKSKNDAKEFMKQLEQMGVDAENAEK